MPAEKQPCGCTLDPELVDAAHSEVAPHHVLKGAAKKAEPAAEEAKPKAEHAAHHKPKHGG